MKKNINFKLIAWLLIGAFIMQTSGSIWAVEPLKNITEQRKAKLLTRYKKDSKLKQLVNKFRETKELRRKKKAGTATKKELQELDRRMKNIKKAAVVIGVTLAVIATIAAIVGGTYYAYGKYKEPIEKEEKEKKEEEEFEKLEKFRQELKRKKFEELSQAIEAGNINEAKSLAAEIPKKEDGYQWQNEIKNALQLAIRKDRVEVAKILIEKGENVEFATQKLGYALKRDRFEMAKLLLDNGARILPSMIENAVNQNKEDLLDIFINKEPTIKDKAMKIAVNSNNLEMIEFLIERDARIEDAYIQTAVNRKNKDLLAILTREPKLKDRALVEAVKNNLSGIAEDLIKQGADQNATTVDNQSVLFLATMNNNEHLVKLLLQRGANAYKKDNKGQTPYDIARTKNYTNIMQLLEGYTPSPAAG